MEDKSPKKKKNAKKQVDPANQPVLPPELADHAQSLAGLNSEELIKLLESLGRIDESIIVSRRRTNKNGKSSKEVGGKQRIMSIEEAVEYEKERARQREEKEEKVRELHGIEADVFQRDEINDEIYPKRLTPNDIARSIEAARLRLEEQDRLDAQKNKVEATREEIVLNVLNLVKKYEAERVARRIARRQRQAVLGKTLEELQEEREARIRRLSGQPEPINETPEEKIERERLEEEQKQELIRNLPGFDKNFRTLVDEAGDVAGENIDAAAAVVRQWIGNIVPDNP